MSDLEDLRVEVLAMFPEVVGLLGDDLSEGGRARLDRAWEKLRSGQYKVVTCGEFRRGKSSLLNAIVERSGLFPVDVDVTTCVVVTLEWGDTEGATVYFADRPAIPVPLGEVREYVTEQANPDNRKNIQRVAMTAPIEILSSGLVLADTPGVGSDNPAHRDATVKVLPEADAILFVCTATDPLSASELRFLREDTYRACPVVVAAVTMIDKKPDPAPVVAAARERVAKETNIAEADVVVMPVSANRKWRALAKSDEAMLAKSGLPALEDQMWNGLGATCGAAQLDEAIDAMTTEIHRVAEILRTQLAGLEGSDDVEAMEAKLQDAMARADNLTKKGAQWRQDLAEDVDFKARPIRRKLEVSLSEERAAFHGKADTDEGRSNPDKLVSDTTHTMTVTYQQAILSFNRAADEVTKEYRELTKLSLDAHVANSEPFVSEVKLSDDALEEDREGFVVW
ncbi:dynamin family protein [Frankia sp. CcWB3]